MSSAVYILDPDLNLLIYRQYRRELDTSFVLSSFKKVFIRNVPVCQPILYGDGLAYILVKCDDIYLMSSVAETDTNVMCVVAFLDKLAHVLRSYFTEYHSLDEENNRINADTVRDNYSLIYELFDEMLDWGLPQLTEFNMLKEYVKPMQRVTWEKTHDKRKSDATELVDKHTEAQINSSISRASTALISWRPKGIFYDRNEYFMDFFEHVKFKYNFQAHKVMVNQISGRVDCRSFLSGMPVLQLQLNENFQQNEQSTTVFNNLNFHQCVQLAEIQQALLSFTPPDGAFKLMTYQILNTSALKPLILVKPDYCVSFEDGKYHLRINGAVLTTFKRKYAMTNVAVTFPLKVPFSPLRINFDEPLRYKTKNGKVIHNLDRHTITWHIEKLDGLSKAEMETDFELVPRRQLYTERTKNQDHFKQSKNDLIYFDLPAEVSALKGKTHNIALNSAIEDVLSSQAENRDILVTVAFELGSLLYSGLKVNYLQIQEKQLHFQSFPWIKYKTVCQGNDYSFVMGPDQIHVKLTDKQKSELEEADKNAEEGEVEEEEEEVVEEDAHPVESAEQAQETQKETEKHTGEIKSKVDKGFKYEDRVIDFEEYKVEGEEDKEKEKEKEKEDSKKNED